MTHSLGKSSSPKGFTYALFIYHKPTGELTWSSFDDNGAKEYYGSKTYWSPQLGRDVDCYTYLKEWDGVPVNADSDNNVYIFVELDP